MGSRNTDGSRISHNNKSIRNHGREIYDADSALAPANLPASGEGNVSRTTRNIGPYMSESDSRTDSKVRRTVTNELFRPGYEVIQEINSNSKLVNEVGFLRSNGGGENILVSDDKTRLIVANFGGFSSYDITDMSTPIKIGTYVFDGGSQTRLSAMSGNLVWAATYANGAVYCVDIERLELVSAISGFTLGAVPQWISGPNDRGVIAVTSRNQNNNNVQLVDYSVPDRPRFRAKYNHAYINNARPVIIGTGLYSIKQTSPIYLSCHDIQNPDKPHFADFTTISGNISMDKIVPFSGGKYLLGVRGQLSNFPVIGVFNIEDPYNMSLTGYVWHKNTELASYDVRTDTIRDAVTNDNYFYQALSDSQGSTPADTNFSKLLVVDLNNPSNPRVVHDRDMFFDEQRNGFGIYVVGTGMYNLDGRRSRTTVGVTTGKTVGLDLWDISNRTNPVHVASGILGGPPEYWGGMNSYGSQYLFGKTYNTIDGGVISVWDVDIDGNIEFISNVGVSGIDVNEHFASAEVVGNRVYCIGKNAKVARVIDITDIRNPVASGETFYDATYMSADYSLASGNYQFIFNATNDVFFAIDWTDVNAPATGSIIGLTNPSYPVMGPRRLHCRTSIDDGCASINIDDPMNPFVEAYNPLPRGEYGMVLNQGHRGSRYLIEGIGPTGIVIWDTLPGPGLTLIGEYADTRLKEYLFWYNGVSKYTEYVLLHTEGGSDAADMFLAILDIKNKTKPRMQFYTTEHVYAAGASGTLGKAISSSAEQWGVGGLENTSANTTPNDRWWPVYGQTAKMILVPKEGPGMIGTRISDTFDPDLTIEEISEEISRGGPGAVIIPIQSNSVTRNIGSGPQVRE